MTRKSPWLVGPRQELLPSGSWQAPENRMRHIVRVPTRSAATQHIQLKLRIEWQEVIFPSTPKTKMVLQHETTLRNG
jgi:hypothetical protein